MSNDINKVFSFELYCKAKDKKALTKGPLNRNFWARKISKKIVVQRSDELSLKKQMGQFVRRALKMNEKAFLRTVVCCYSYGSGRISMWAWILTANEYYQCHAESATLNV